MGLCMNPLSSVSLAYEEEKKRKENSMTEEEKSVINKLESIRVNVEGKLYNFEAARILYLINKLKKENEEKDKQIKKIYKQY